MFQFRPEKELTCVAEGQGTFFAKQGAMIAYQGQFKAEKVLLDPNGGNLVGAVINHVARRVSGENMPLMKVTGSGRYYMADNASHVSVVTLDPGQSISVESENLLAFSEDCKYSVRFIGVGVISQKGLFTSKLTNMGNGQVVIKTDGNPLALETPCVVDPDAVVCWTGPDPSFKVDVSWKTLIGQTSGESYALEFKQPGELVIVQPSERMSGLKIGMDDQRYQPQRQDSPMSAMGDMFGGQSHNHGHNHGQQSNGGLGDVINSVRRFID